MGLKTRITSDHHFASFGAYVIGRGWGSMAAAGFGDWDPVVECLSNTVLVYGDFLVENAAGHYSAGQDLTLDLMPYKPEASGYSAVSDYHRHAGIIPGVVAASRLLNGVPPAGAVPSNEREVSHPGVRGEVELKRDPSSWNLFSGAQTRQIINSGGRPIQGSGFWAYLGNINHACSYAPVAGSVMTYYGHHSAYSSNYPKRTTQYTIEQMLNGTYAGIGQLDYKQHNSTFAHRTRLTSLTFEVLPGGFVVNYTHEVQTYGSGAYHVGIAKFRGRLTHTLKSMRVPSTWPSPSGGIADLRRCFDFDEKWEHWTDSVTYPAAGRIWWGNAGVPGFYKVVQTGGARFAECIVLTDPVPCRAQSIAPDPIPRIVSKLSPITFHGEVGKRQGDIRASAFQSTFSAYESMTSSLGQNLIEQVAGLGGVASYLPRLKDALDILRTVAKKDLPGTVKGIVDLATEMRLRYSFQYAPDLDFVITTLPLIDGAIQRLLVGGKEVVVGRGIFEWDFPNGEFYRPTSRLKTCTKIVGVRDNSSAAAKILGLDALGVLPSPGRLWDLVPFSFVIDWFSSIGDRIRDIEGSVLLTLTPPSYLVHSFLVRTDISDEELSAAGLSRVGSGTVEWRSYRREVSTSLPVPYQGRYDFRLPANPPSWMTAGSLAWQIFAK